MLIPTILLALTVLSPDTAHGGAVIDMSAANVPVLLGPTENAQFGHSLAIGDVDGDGDNEMVVGAPGDSGPMGIPNVGAVYVIESIVLETAERPAVADMVASLVLAGPWRNGRFGSSLCLCDLDGDGAEDLIVGAPSSGDEEALESGALAVYLGREGAMLAPEPDIIIRGDWSGGRFGSTLAGADLDNDGRVELLVGAPRAGEEGGRGPGIVYAFSGSDLVPGEFSAAEVAAATIRGERPGDSLGGLAVGDLNGDGSSELVLSSARADGDGAELIDAGTVYVIDAADVLERRDVSLSNETSLAVFEGNATRGYFGGSLSVGDIDDDGRADLLVSAYASGRRWEKVEASGEAFIAFGLDVPGGDVADRGTDAGPTAPQGAESGGSLSGPGGEPPIGGALSFVSRRRWDVYGLPVLLADLNGDRSDEVIVAAQFADGPERERQACGEVYIYWGSLKSVMSAKAGKPDLADVTLVGPHENGMFGGSLAVRNIIAGHLPDLVVGEPDYPGEGSGTLPGRGAVSVVPDSLFLR